MDSRLLALVDEDLEALLEAYLVALVGETYDRIACKYSWNGPRVEQVKMEIGEWVLAKLAYPSSIDIPDLIQREVLEPAKPKRDYRQAIFHRDDFKCVLCGSDENLTVDHIIPISKGGTETLDNLRTLCKSCNSKKGAKLESNGTMKEEHP